MINRLVGWKIEALDSVALSFTHSMLAKPNVTTAPSSMQHYMHPISQTIPPLKQKTGIVKSKVPPPVPPRGSPRVDRRTSTGSQKSSQMYGVSPRNMSPGTRNYLNDKYFDVVQPNSNNMCRLTPLNLQKLSARRASAPTPIFGLRRSPTCVHDWLQINDFAASDFDEYILQSKELETVDNSMANTKPNNHRPIAFRTGYLQKQSSFRNYGGDKSVRSMVEKYSNKSHKNDVELKINHQPAIEPSDNFIRKNIVSDRVKAYRFDSTNPSSNQMIPSIQITSSERDILNVLKRKCHNRSCDSMHESNVKRNEILRTHSNINRSNGNDKFVDAFSLDGEFV